MRGYVIAEHQPTDDFAGAEEAAEKVNNKSEFTVTISMDNLDEFLNDPQHNASARGSIRVDGLTRPRGCRSAVASSTSLRRPRIRTSAT